MKKRPPQPWTPEDEARLRALAAAGRTTATIAERLKRTEATIRYKARALNIILARVANGLKAKGK
jgi:DNA-binding NarL/FixJ family response regulator